MPNITRIMSTNSRNPQWQPIMVQPRESSYSSSSISPSKAAPVAPPKHSDVSLPSSPFRTQPFKVRDEMGFHVDALSVSSNRKGKMREVQKESTPTIAGKKPRRKWSEEEMQVLMQGCRLPDVGNWKNMLQDPNLEFQDRSAADLKDRFRTHFPDAYKKHYPNPRPSFGKLGSNRRRIFPEAQDLDALRADYEKYSSLYAAIEEDSKKSRRSTNEASGYKPEHSLRASGDRLSITESAGQGRSISDEEEGSPIDLLLNFSLPPALAESNRNGKGSSRGRNINAVNNQDIGATPGDGEPALPKYADVATTFTREEYTAIAICYDIYGLSSSSIIVADDVLRARRNEVLDLIWCFQTYDVLQSMKAIILGESNEFDLFLSILSSKSVSFHYFDLTLPTSSRTERHSPEPSSPRPLPDIPAHFASRLEQGDLAARLLQANENSLARRGKAVQGIRKWNSESEIRFQERHGGPSPLNFGVPLQFDFESFSKTTKKAKKSNSSSSSYESKSGYHSRSSSLSSSSRIPGSIRTNTEFPFAFPVDPLSVDYARRSISPAIQPDDDSAYLDPRPLTPSPSPPVTQPYYTHSDTSFSEYLGADDSVAPQSADDLMDPCAEK